MTIEVGYQDYLNEHLPEGIAQTAYDPVYMASKTLYEQLETDGNLFDLNNLVTLTEEGLGALRANISGTVVPQLEKDSAHYQNSFLSGDGSRLDAESYTTHYADYQNTLAMGIVHERFVVSGLEVSDIRDALDGAIDDFSVRTIGQLDSALELKGRIVELATDLGARDIEALNEHRAEIDALPENAKILLREGIEAALETRLAENPEIATQIEAFRTELDTSVATITEAVPVVDPAAAAPALERTPATPTGP